MELNLTKKFPLKLKSSVTALSLSDDEELLAVSQESEDITDQNISIWSTKDYKSQSFFASTPYTTVRSLLLIDQIKAIIYPSDSEVIIQPLNNSDTQKNIQINDTRKITYNKFSNSIIVSGENCIEFTLNETQSPHIIISDSDYKIDDVFLTPPLVEIINDKYVIVGNLYNPESVNLNMSKINLETPPNYAVQLDYDNTTKRIIALDYPNYKIHIWDENGQKIELDNLSNSTRTYSSFCVIPGREMLVTGNKLGFISVYDLKTGNLISEGQFQKRNIRSLVATKDLRIFSGSEDYSLICLQLK
jgi:WD40 repeat protein